LQTGDALAYLGSLTGFGARLRADARRAGRLAPALLIVLATMAAPFAQAASKKSKAATPRIAASIVVDMNTGAILGAESAETPRHPASLTKMMTLYVLFGYLRAGKITPDTDLVVSAHAANQAPTKLGLKPGTTIKVTDAAKALVTQSANDAAATIAENLGGTEENFARLMTETGRRIGMTKTVFRNASGLPNEEQVTTARDMAILAAHLIHDYPEYYKVFETRYFSFKGRKYKNHNKLLFGYKGTDGIKTGYTRASGFNLAASAQRGNKHLLAVVLGGKTGSQRDTATRALLDKHFSKASETKPTEEQRVASFVGAPPPPLPAIKKPVLAMAAAAPVPARVAGPAEGDITEPAPAQKTVLAALSGPASKPSAKTGAREVRYDGDYHVQVGAYMSQAEAENRLGMVQQRATDLLDGHLPFTASFMKDDQEWYRARFAGFSQDSAQATCKALKKLSLDCAVMLAE
jgi:D-alanyl-D-alanine carboxypeptidase